MTPTDATRPADGPGPDSGHTGTHDAREGLRGLLGERYEAVIEKALNAVDTPHHGYQVTRGNVDERDVETALAAVLPDLLAEERRLGRAEGWARGMREQGECSNPQGACARRSWDCKHPNPYRTEGNAR